MFTCTGCKDFKIVPQFDIEGKIYYYSLCLRHDQLLNRPEFEQVGRPSWCDDVMTEQSFLDCSQSEQVFNPALPEVDAIEYRIQLILTERSNSFNVDNYQNIRNIYQFANILRTFKTIIDLDYFVLDNSESSDNCP